MRFLSPEAARAELARRNIPCTADAFVNKAEDGDLVVVQLFVRKGMSVNTANNAGVTALMRASSGGRFEVVKYLVELGADKTAKNAAGWTALRSAAAAGQLEVVEYLVEQGADIEDTDRYGGTPRALAAQAGHLAVASYLEKVAARAELESRGIDYTAEAFRVAARDGDLVVVKLFVEAGMSVDTADEEGYTALIGAAENSRLAVVEYLVDQGADVDAKNNGGYTALYRAARYGHLSVVRYLVEQGADVQATDRTRTARELAERKGHTDIAAYLESVGGYGVLCELCLLCELCKAHKFIHKEDCDAFFAVGFGLALCFVR